MHELQLAERITFPSSFDKYHQALNVSPLCYPQMRTSIWKSSQNLQHTQRGNVHTTEPDAHLLFLISKERDSCSSN